MTPVLLKMQADLEHYHICMSWLIFFFFFFLQITMSYNSCDTKESKNNFLFNLTLLHSERPKLLTILAFLSAIGLKC